VRREFACSAIVTDASATVQPASPILPMEANGNADAQFATPRLGARTGRSNATGRRFDERASA